MGCKKALENLMFACQISPMVRNVPDDAMVKFRIIWV